MQTETILSTLREQIDEYTQKREELLSRLGKSMAIHFAPQIIPEMIIAELYVNTYTELIASLKLHLNDDPELGATACANDTSARIAREQKQLLDHVSMTHSTNQITNTIDAMRLQFNPTRWGIMNTFVSDLKSGE